MPDMRACIERAKKKLVKLKNRFRGEEPDKREVEQTRQDGNLLMRLPRELRDEIYFYLFSSTRFMYGRRFDFTEEYTDTREFTRISCHELEKFRPSPHGLALLRSCRQIRLDIGSAWLQHVIFCFESPGVVSSRLGQVPWETFSLIRHVRIASDALQLRWSSPAERKVINACFDLLLRMSLDTLTVFGPATPWWSYEDLYLFIKYGRGWKELRYITYTSAFVHKRVIYRNQREEIMLPMEPQPAAWQRDLEKRDGPNSGASVTMYKSTDPSNPLSVMRSTLRTELSYPPTPTTGVDHSDAGGISQVLDLKKDTTGILIVVKRGKNSNWQGAQKNDHEEPMSSVFPWVRAKDNKRWDDRQNASRLFYIYRIDSVKYCEKDGRKHNVEFRRGPKKTLVDNYRHVDDYAFPPYGFRTEHLPLVPWKDPDHFCWLRDVRGRGYWVACAIPIVRLKP